MAAKEKPIKNVVLVGQGGVGKTMLAEAMLHLTGKTTRLGGHAGTKPTLDYDSQESARGFSISTTMAPIEWAGTRINVLDAPCYPDFVGDAYAAMSVGETALFVVDANDGPQTTTTRLWFAAEDLSLARAIFINRLDKPEADFDSALEMCRERFGSNSSDFELGAIYWLILKNFDAIVEIFHIIATAPKGCVLFHCSVGKDRTGVLAMLLLGLAGVDKWDIVANYVQSFPNLMRDEVYAADYHDSEQFGSREGLESSPESIEFAWDVIERAFGDVRSYLVGCGVSEEDLDAVFARLTQQPAPIPATRQLDHTPIPFMPSASGRTKGGAGACSVCPA
jgi:hypothetical protein